MSNNDWLDVLGLKMKEAIKKYYYPDLEPQHISTKKCAEIRSILSKVPSEDNALKKMMLKRILKGRIEEIQQKGDVLSLQIGIRHKGELYVVEMELEGIQWHFVAIQYTGKAPQQPLIWGLSTALALSVILLCAIVLKDLGEASVNADASPAVDEFATNGSIDDLQQFAEDNDYVLYTEEEFNEIVGLYIEEALAEEQKSSGVAEDQPTAENDTEQEAKDEGQAGSENPAGSGEEADSADTEDQQTVQITIQPGMSSHEIASLLVQEDLIQNEEELEELLIALDVENKLRSGTFDIPRPSTYMEMINILTGEQ